MSLRIMLPLLLVITLSGFAICGCASAGISDLLDNVGAGIINTLESARTSLNLNNIPPAYDPYWDDLGPKMVKEGMWTLAGVVVPTNVVKTIAEDGLPTSWYDPFWDDLGPAMILDSVKVLGYAVPASAASAAEATLETSEEIADAYDSSKNIFNLFQGEKSLAFAYVSTINVGADSVNEIENTADFMGDLTKLVKVVKIAGKIDSETQKMNLAAELAQQGIGSPLLSPSSGTLGFSAQNKDGTSIPETSGETYFDQANDVWYIDAYSWTGDKSLYDKPAAPMYFVSGEQNTYGYNWVYLPYSRTGMTYDQGYFDWCIETLASMGQSAPSAGYGLLIDEGQNGAGGW